MIVIIDNYDSFTFNLYQYLGQLGQDVRVFRNDEITVDELAKLPVERIVLSPGPGRPQDAGISKDVVRCFGPTTPLLGVCLGHQAIVEEFGGEIVHAPSLYHGKCSLIKHDGSELFAGIPQPMQVMRYHSLTVSARTVPRELVVSARTDMGDIMAVRHHHYPVFGVQFHPESIYTPDGLTLLQNFLSIQGKGGRTDDVSSF